jgi:O-antigen/teichoic acid export membrane protein
MALQLLVSILNALGDIRRAGWAMLIASATTVALVYPLLRLGEVGLAMTVGAGSVVGVVVGLRLLVRHHPGLFGPLTAAASSVRLANFSFPMALQPLIYVSGTLYVQGVVAKEYGVHGLGSFAAATLLIDTACYVLMAGARNHVLPTLARARAEDRTAFYSYALTYFCSAAALAGIGLIVAAPLVSRVLFGVKFADTNGIIAVMALSMPAQAVAYTASAVLNSSRRYWLCVLGDITWTAAYVGVALALVSRHVSIEWAGLAYTAALITAAAIYSLLVFLSDDSTKVEARPVLLALGCTLAGAALALIATRSRVVAAALGLALAAVLVRQLIGLGRAPDARRQV